MVIPKALLENCKQKFTNNEQKLAKRNQLRQKTYKKPNQHPFQISLGHTMIRALWMLLGIYLQLVKHREIRMGSWVTGITIQLLRPSWRAEVSIGIRRLRFSARSLIRHFNIIQHIQMSQDQKQETSFQEQQKLIKPWIQQGESKILFNNQLLRVQSTSQLLQPPWLKSEVLGLQRLIGLKELKWRDQQN